MVNPDTGRDRIYLIHASQGSSAAAVWPQGDMRPADSPVLLTQRSQDKLCTACTSDYV